MPNNSLKNLIHFLLLVFCPATLWANDCTNNTDFVVGAGISDVTGPAAEVGMMGYGMIQQQTSGISQRLWARAFVIESPCNGKSVVLVNADLGQIFQAVKEEVVNKLQLKYGNHYLSENVLISANHTHSGPGGYSTYTLYNITSLGFNRKNFDTIVNGIVNAIEIAHENKKPAKIRIITDKLEGISYNRAKNAYLRNPENERSKYQSDVDTDMTLLKFDTVDGKPIGMINWFPLHGVSLNNKNTLISGDNKGYAEYLFEKDFNSTYRPGAFVAAFAQSNAGDVSPNPYGESGKSGLEGLKTLAKAGNAQYIKAKELYNKAQTLVKGGVDFRQQYYAMDNITVDKKYADGNLRSTCKAAIGISMLAGTQDGEGIGKQGISCENVSDIFSKIACELVTTPCQREKPIFITTGSQFPYPWTPNILPLQLIQIGNITLAAAPFEITTMSGRRIKNGLKAILQEQHVVISSLSNAYAGYVATNEEYGLQLYEAASTHFGPWQLAAMQQEFDKLAIALREHKIVTNHLTPPNLLNTQLELQPDVWFDDKPLTKNFGDLQQDVAPTYKPGDTVEAIFWGGHPKNAFAAKPITLADKAQGFNFLEVQQFKNNKWVTIRYDRDFDTEYQWSRNAIAYSLIKIVWRIPHDIEKGQYRLVHFGNWKSGWTGKISSYEGYSSAFKII